jgi:5-methylthioadenosine/S-adenosylhomocysteine deaminase
MHSPNLNPIHGKETVVSDLVYSASPKNVATTIVDGQLLMLNRQLITMNPQETVQSTEQIANQLFRP